MEAWKLTVWSRYRASIDEVWDQKTDPHALAREFLPCLHLRVDDVEGLRQALREAGCGTFAGRVTGPIGLIGLSWPLEVRETRPTVFYCDASHNRLFTEFVHQHRFEQTPAGLVRYVDEVTFTPAFRPRRLVAEVMRALFVHRHRQAARELRVDGDAVARTWLRRVSAPLRAGGATSV
ncbi:MAG: hypothetical protein JRJ84_15985 [Deltaproteobacteria bacterium]|nr:hypothetical protein [Deltaproteobacteria bacterium]